MPISLTTAFSYEPGHGQSTISYGEVKIICFTQVTEENRIDMHVQYGDTVDGKWVPGVVPVHMLSIQDTPAIPPDIPAGNDYLMFVGTKYPTSTSNLLYVEVANTLYQYLIDQGLYAGTIV